MWSLGRARNTFLQALVNVGAICKLGWREPVQARGCAIPNAGVLPVFDGDHALPVLRGHVFIEALVAQAAVEAFDNVFFLPLRNGAEVSSLSLALVTIRGTAAAFGDPVEFPHHALSGR